MLYTIIPVEMVLDDGREPAPALLEMSVQGRRLLAAQGPGGDWTLERLLSTDPADYLEPGFQPGAVLSRGPRGL